MDFNHKLKLGFTFILLFFLILNLIRYMDFYSYCKLTQHRLDIFEKRKNVRSSSYSQTSNLFQKKCKEIFKDFSDHIFLQFTFNKVYELIKPEYVFDQMSEDEAVLVIEHIERTHLDMNSDLQFFKLTNFIFYVCNLYFISVFVLLMSFIVNRSVGFFFIYFVIEGYLNFYTDTSFNTVLFLRNISPFKIIINVNDYVYSQS